VRQWHPTRLDGGAIIVFAIAVALIYVATQPEGHLSLMHAPWRGLVVSGAPPSQSAPSLGVLHPHASINTFRSATGTSEHNSDSITPSTTPTVTQDKPILLQLKAQSQVTDEKPPKAGGGVKNSLPIRRPTGEVMQ
jgi:hypothetical protein